MKREEALQKLAERQKELHNMGVASLALFRSLAREEGTDRSDVDLLVEFDRPVGLFQFIRVQQYLEDVLGVEKVDLVMPDALREEFRDEVLREAIRAA